MSNDDNTPTISRLARPWFLALGLAALAAACAPEGEDRADTRFEGEEPMAEMSNETRPADDMTMDDEAARTGESMRLVLGESAEFGEHITYADGRPVYLFTADTKGEASACYDACAQAWPPVTGSFEATEGLDAGLLGTITREDGTLQVTYAGWPLYEFTRDEVGSEPQGQDIESFGGEWYLIGASGEEVHASASTSEEAPSEEASADPAASEPSENR